MNRIVMIVLILVVALILSVPFVFGVFAQHSVEMLMYEYEKDLPPAVRIAERDYERGWFSSDVRWRVTYDVGPGLGSDPSMPLNPLTGGSMTLNLSGKVHHGPMPVTAIFTDVGFQPTAMAVVEVGTGVTLPDGAPFDIPGNVFAIIKYDGSGSLEYHAEQQALNIGNGQISGDWGGGHMTGSFTPDFSTFEVDGRFEVVNLNGIEAGVGDGLAIGPTTIDMQGTRTPYDFYVGPVKAEIGEVALMTGGAPFISVKGITYEVDSSMTGENLNADVGFAIAEVSNPMFPGGGMSLDLSLNGINAPALKNILEATEAGGSDRLLQAQLAQEALAENFTGLISGGPELHLNELIVDTPMGRVEVKLNLVVPSPAAGEIVSPLDLITRVNGDALIRVPQILVQQAASMNPMVGGQLDQFVQNGFIQVDGDQYVIDAKYSNGLLNLNGLPMALPPM